LEFFGAIWISQRVCGIAIFRRAGRPEWHYRGRVSSGLPLPPLRGERQENVDPTGDSWRKACKRASSLPNITRIPAKAFDGVIDVGTRIFPRSSGGDPHRLINPEILQKDIREICDFRGGQSARVEDFLPHLWHAAVVEDEGSHRGQRETKRMARGRLAGQDANIERKTVASQAVNILDECFTLALDHRGLRVQNPANPFQFRMNPISLPSRS